MKKNMFVIHLLLLFSSLGPLHCVSNSLQHFTQKETRNFITNAVLVFNSIQLMKDTLSVTSASLLIPIKPADGRRGPSKQMQTPVNTLELLNSSQNGYSLAQTKEMLCFGSPERHYKILPTLKHILGNVRGFFHCFLSNFSFEPRAIYCFVMQQYAFF